MTRLKALLKKADKAAVIGMTAAAVAMAALGAGGVKTYASDYSVQMYVDSSDESLVLDGEHGTATKTDRLTMIMTALP